MDKTGFDITLSEAEIQELQNAVVSPAKTPSRSKKDVNHKKSGAGVSSLLTKNETDDENMGAGAKSQLWQTYKDEVADAFGVDIGQMSDVGDYDLEMIEESNDELQRQLELLKEVKKNSTLLQENINFKEKFTNWKWQRKIRPQKVVAEKQAHCKMVDAGLLLVETKM